MGKSIDPFIGFLVFAIFLGWFLPLPVFLESAMALFSRIGIAFIFLFYGLKLDLSVLLKGLKNWQAHLLIQGTTFLLFPLMTIFFLPLFQWMDKEHLWLPLFFLAALPSTVSSSVIFTNIAKGNITIAIFNASISGVLAILFTPFWMGLFQQKQGGLELGGVFNNLFFQVLLPLIIGLFLNKRLRFLPLKFPFFFAWYDKLIILVIVYKSFSNSFKTSFTAYTDLLDFIWMSIIIVLVFFIVFRAVRVLVKVLNISFADGKAILLCSTQKSLVHGSVFILVLVEDANERGFILLPIMIYHTFQLVYFSYISPKWAKVNNW
jgi:sodium/bile acid cotransporter 7